MSNACKLYNNFNKFIKFLLYFIIIVIVIFFKIKLIYFNNNNNNIYSENANIVQSV